MSTRKEMVSLRIAPELRRKLKRASEKAKPPRTATDIVERGIELAIEEIENDER